MDKLEFRTLRADEIDVRVGQNSKDKKKFSLLLYKDARCDMRILDETVTPLGWARNHFELKGNIYCKVGIYDKDNDIWVWKSDVGTESKTEATKGETSDSFKRACFNWGIGRELYTSPAIWLPSEAPRYGYKVSNIEYKDGCIVDLTLIDHYGQIIYPTNNNNYAQRNLNTRPASATSTQSKPQGNYTKTDTQPFKCSMCGKNIVSNVAAYSKSKYNKYLCRDCQKKEK